MNQEIIAKRQQQVLHDKKWIKFLRRTWLFRFIPFVEFALAAGSLATGNVHADSDFDVIIGARYGRIFTARFFSVLGFGLFGWRRKRLHGGAVYMTDKSNKTYKSETADKVCLNHFVTEKSYRLAEPHNAYWKNLYQNLVPVYGDPEKINSFFAANQDWMGERVYTDDLRHKYRGPSFVEKIRECLLGGRLGDWLERRLKNFQVKRIERGLAESAGYKPRLIYTDAELEFHPHTKRIEEYLQQLTK